MFGSTCPEQDANFAVAGKPRRLHEARLAPDIGFRARHAGIKREVHDRSCENDVLHGVAERRDDAHRQHEQRERHDGVGDAADNAVGPAAEEACRDAGQPAHQEHQRDRGDRDEKIEPRGDDDAAENVAAELIGAEPVGRRWRLERHRRVAGQRIVRHDVGSEGRGEHDQREQAEREARDLVFADDVAAVPQNAAKPLGCGDREVDAPMSVMLRASRADRSGRKGCR